MFNKVIKYAKDNPGNGYLFAFSGILAIVAVVAMIALHSLAPIGIIIALGLIIGSYAGGKWLAEKAKIPRFLSPLFGLAAFAMVFVVTHWIMGWPLPIR
ncbi:MAG: hypothetical protein AB7G62_01255 [Magnetospirillum sp.]